MFFWTFFYNWPSYSFLKINIYLNLYLKFQFLTHKEQTLSLMKSNPLILFRKIIVGIKIVRDVLIFTEGKMQHY